MRLDCLRGLDFWPQAQFAFLSQLGSFSGEWLLEGFESKVSAWGLGLCSGRILDSRDSANLPRLDDGRWNLLRGRRDAASGCRWLDCRLHLHGLADGPDDGRHEVASPRSLK